MRSGWNSQTIDTIYLDEHTKTTFKHQNILPQTVDPSDGKTESNCRICLQPCPNVRYCLCTGGLLTHQNCLSQFLLTRIRNHSRRLDQLSCQICNTQYVVQSAYNCQVSMKSCGDKINKHQLRCAMYTLFFLCVFAYYGFIGYLYATKQLANVVYVTLIIVTVCVCVMFVLFFGVWAYQFLFEVSLDNIKRVLSIEQRNLNSQLSQSRTNRRRNKSLTNLF